MHFNHMHVKAYIWRRAGEQHAPTEYSLFLPRDTAGEPPVSHT